MTRRKLMMVAAASPILARAAAESSPEKPKVTTSETWIAMVDPRFIMVYHLGEFEECDKRPLQDPFAPGGEEKLVEKLPMGRYLGGAFEILDVAAVIAAMKKRIRISKEQLSSIMAAVLDSNVQAMLADCYEPHHLVVCYDEFGTPKAAIEICFGCNQVRIRPGENLVMSNRYDMVALARLFVSWGLPLGGKEPRSLEEYEQRDREWRKNAEERENRPKE